MEQAFVGYRALRQVQWNDLCCQMVRCKSSDALSIAPDEVRSSSRKLVPLIKTKSTLVLNFLCFFDCIQIDAVDITHCNCNY